MSQPIESLPVAAAPPAELPRLILARGHVQPLWAGHPWVFAQAVARWEGQPTAGGEVLVCDAQGTPLGRALHSPGSAIVARLFTRTADRAIDLGLFEQRLRAAIERRTRLGLPSAATTGYRLVHAEGDDLPGLIVDRMGDVLCVQWGTIGLARRDEQLLDLLQELLAPRAIVDRSSQRTAQQEGFTARPGVRRGDAQLSALEFTELGLRHRIPLSIGQKTGFYFDQRPLRERVEQLSQGRRVLDTYCFTGSLALAAARGGASEVVGIDSSGPALAAAAEMARLNQLGERVRWIEGDAPAELGRLRDFELVICDPPKLAPGRGARGRAQEAMRRIAAAAHRATRPGGLVILSSCSAALGPAELMRALALGARDAARRAVVWERLSQGADHPVPAAFPEGQYLSTVIAESLAV